MALFSFGVYWFGFSFFFFYDDEREPWWAGKRLTTAVPFSACFRPSTAAAATDELTWFQLIEDSTLRNMAEL